MAELVSVWKAADGSFHETQAEAEAQDGRVWRRRRVLLLVVRGNEAVGLQSAAELLQLDNGQVEKLAQWIEHAGLSIFNALSPSAEAPNGNTDPEGP
jgi:hypothetical protein